MKDLTKFIGEAKPEYSKPFTVLDSHGVVWTISTDEVCLFAVKGVNKGPRFRGSSLSTVLNLLRIPPIHPVKFSSYSVMGIHDIRGLGRILGVVVDLERFDRILKEFPDGVVTLWNVSNVLGLPGLAFTCSDCLGILMGFDGDLSEVPDCELSVLDGSPMEEFCED